jgi:hypothetical protein
MTVLEESDALHERVLAFGLRALDGTPQSDTFDDVAIALAHHQRKHSPGFCRLVESHGSSLATVEEIPAVPVEAFRVSRVATHPPELDGARFVTSGTTSGATGTHYVRRTSTHARLSVAFGARALLDSPAPRIAVALCQPPLGSSASSLAFMIARFMEAWDGRSLRDGGRFDVLEAGRWLAGPDGVDVEGLESAAELALRRGEPLLVFATGFALMLLLDALAGRTLSAPPETVVMPTGGFKGRTREVAPDALVRDTAAAFGIDDARIVGEYGMTELSSQLYEGTLPGGGLANRRGVFVSPPWLRATAVDPRSLEELPPGEVGIGRFVDLANVDSAVCVVTQDRVRVVPDGIELWGRESGAPERGCSLALEQMVR